LGASVGKSVSFSNEELGLSAVGLSTGPSTNGNGNTGNTANPLRGSDDYIRDMLLERKDAPISSWFELTASNNLRLVNGIKKGSSGMQSSGIQQEDSENQNNEDDNNKTQKDLKSTRLSPLNQNNTSSSGDQKSGGQVKNTSSVVVEEDSDADAVSEGEVEVDPQSDSISFSDIGAKSIEFKVF
jgi:hypothetical protein